MYENIKSDITKLSAAGQRIINQAIDQNRDLTSSELDLIEAMAGKIEDLKLELPAEGPLTVERGNGRTMQARATQSAYEIKPPHAAKDYHSLFGRDGYRWQDKQSTFFNAVFSGRHHPGLITNSMTESVPSDGGFLVPMEYASQIHAVSLENEIVMPRCFVQPMRSNTINIPAMNIGDHSSSLFGGFTASYVAETGTINEHDPKVRNMELNSKKLTGLLRFSSELASDIPGGENQIIQICGKGLSWYRDKAFLKGTGAGQPLGVLNANCTIEVDAEGGQKADTIAYENLTKMMAAMYAGGFSNSVWVCHQSTIPQLLTLSLAVGTGGAPVPVLNQSNGLFTMLTRPVIFTEKTEKLGDRGDIMLCDFSQYVVGLRSEMRFDLSIHVAFATDELLARLIERHDGQPLWSEPLTLEDGSTQVSPFVVLGAR